MTHGRTALTLLTAALVAGPMVAGERPLAKEHLQAPRVRALELRSSLGLDDRHDFAVTRGHVDELGQSHTRMKQLFQGVRVWGGEAIAHMDANGTERPMTAELRRNISLSVMPTLDGTEALGRAHADLNPKGAYAVAPTSELVVYPVMRGRQVMSYKLAYHIHTELENGAEETAHTDYMVDAHTGAILDKWSTLRTTDATGTGISQFSGTVSIHTNYTGSTYQLYDVYRGMNIKTYDLAHGTSGTGTLYSDSDNTWGDGNNYTGSSTSTSGTTGQTAAVDAHYGVEMTYDFYKNVLGRSGIDGNNTATYSRVHYSTSYDNAFWSDTCFCMTYGDGNYFKSLEALDVAGHEMSHGVCANSADLTYSGESGGLNEANSDIFGNMVELYARNGFTMPSTVANTDACWTVGEVLETTKYTTPLRYMYKPSLDGSSKDAWYSSLGSLDVHYSSGPANRMFFFLSQGASSTSSSNYYSSYTPSGFTGIGPEAATKIWYRALTTYMTSSTTYSSARTACLNAATDLYGASSTQYAAVQNAFAAINVGSAATSVSVAISPTTASVAAGATYQFTATVSGSTTTTVTWTCSGGSVSTSGLYTAPSTAGTYTVTATSTADTTKSATATVTVTSTGTVSISMTPTTATVVAGGTQQFTATVSGSTNTSVTYSVTGGSISTSGLYTAPSTAGTYYVTATAAADTSKTATSTVTVTASTTTSYTEVESNGSTSTANSLGSAITTVTGYIGSSTDSDYFKLLVPAYTTLKVGMTGPSTKDYDLYLYNSSGTQKAYSYGSTSTESLSYYNSSSSAAYFYIKVKGYSGAYSTSIPYILTITR